MECFLLNSTIKKHFNHMSNIGLHLSDYLVGLRVNFILCLIAVSLRIFYILSKTVHMNVLHQIKKAKLPRFQDCHIFHVDRLNQSIRFRHTYCILNFRFQSSGQRSQKNKVLFGNQTYYSELPLTFKVVWFPKIKEMIY